MNNFNQEMGAAASTKSRHLVLKHSIDFVENLDIHGGALNLQQFQLAPETDVMLSAGGDFDEEFATITNGYRDWDDVVNKWDVAKTNIKARVTTPAASPSSTAHSDFDPDKAVDLFSWEFDVWNLNEEQLINAGMALFHRNFHGAGSTVEMDVHAMYRLFSEVKHYMTRHKNPYHNFVHVIDVLQSCSTIMFTFDAKQWFENYEIECFSLLLSGLVHDLDHPGLNNVYHANAVTALAIRYNDVSILENYHCALAFEILYNPQFNVVPALSVVQRKTIRKLMIQLILATDMTVHFALQGEVTNAVERIKQGTLTPKDCPEKDRIVLLKSILHSADISNPAKEWKMSKQWSDLVLEEFFMQGDREKREGLPVSMNCDRDTTKQDELSLNFADFIIAPFALTLLGWIPKYSHACKVIGENRRKWHGILVNRLKTTVVDDKVLAETVGKWDTKAAAMEDKLKAVGLS